eukprot:Blabericola_migrator_1__5306@NODE_2723_length_2423_cov_49_844228_g1705_i0_p2_GENE_NODE_2723_length_2423_cov_49_844228_g1705_i0NODE_2723_length_2423_cov_49_844228_g1705_i0_p2_ORF_typecomplete_len295_score24_20_NODE_2723_length_2423_cov_49_844228_g1705_i02151099
MDCITYGCIANIKGQIRIVRGTQTRRKRRSKRRYAIQKYRPPFLTQLVTECLKVRIHRVDTQTIVCKNLFPFDRPLLTPFPQWLSYGYHIEISCGLDIDVISTTASASPDEANCSLSPAEETSFPVAALPPIITGEPLNQISQDECPFNRIAEVLDKTHHFVGRIRTELEPVREDQPDEDQLFDPFKTSTDCGDSNLNIATEGETRSADSEAEQTDTRSENWQHEIIYVQDVDVEEDQRGLLEPTARNEAQRSRPRTIREAAAMVYRLLIFIMLEWWKDILLRGQQGDEDFFWP